MRIIATLFLVTTLAFGAAGCAGRSILSGGTSVTAHTTNPATNREIAGLYGAYGIAVTAAVSYRRYCYGFKTVEEAPGVCKERRQVVTKMQQLDRKARAALVSARKFVRENPTLSAITAIGAARAAIADYQQVVDSFSVPK